MAWKRAVVGRRGSSCPPPEAEFERAFRRVQPLVNGQKLDQKYPLRGNAVFINRVVLLMRLDQRMCPDQSLEAAVKVLLETMPSILPDNKRITDKTLSSDSGGDAPARLAPQQGDCRTYELTWRSSGKGRPSGKGRLSHPELANDAALDVRLHEIHLHDSLTLYLVTRLSEDAVERSKLSELYRHRRRCGD